MTEEDVLNAWRKTAIPKDDFEKEAYEIVENALEKQIPKKVIRLNEDEYYDYKCPNCGLPDLDCMGKKYCNCGQKLDRR